MMKKLLVACAITAAALFCSSKASAQAYKNGDNLLNLGIGVGGTYSGTSFGGSFEHGVTDAISVGVGADILHYNYTSSSYNFFYFAVRGSYHLGEVFKLTDNKFDPYAGLGLGYVTYGNYVSSGVFLQAHVGARYYLGTGVGVFGEIGAGASVLKVGVAFKF